MEYSTPTNNKPYDGWMDVMRLNDIPVVLHDAITEKPDDHDFIIPICYCPGDGEDLSKLPLSEWPWELPCVIAADVIPGKDLCLVTETSVALWWISLEEIQDLICKYVNNDHFAHKAMFIAMKYLEEQIGGDSNG